VVKIVKNKLKKILKEKGIKQQMLAELVGLSKQTISNIVNNRYTPTLETAFIIAYYLNMKIDDIFYLDLS
jgi:putative transcriptional regulator